MRRTHAAILVGFMAIGLAVVASGQPTTGGGGFTELYRVEVADAPDLEIVMGLIKRAGESTGAKHYHPGGEFESSFLHDTGHVQHELNALFRRLPAPAKKGAIRGRYGLLNKLGSSLLENTHDLFPA